MTGGVPARGYGKVAALNAASALIVLALGLDGLQLGLRGRTAEAAGLFSLPPWPVYAVFVGAAVSLSALAIAAFARRAPPDAKVFRLLPIALVLALSVQYLVLDSPEPRGRRVDDAAAAQLLLIGEYWEPWTWGELPSLPAEVEKVVAAAVAQFGGAPTYFVRGERMDRWAVLVEEGCTGPKLTVPPGVRAGTVLYCLSVDHQQAWLTGVGSGGAIGKPTLLTYEGQPAITVLRAGKAPTPRPDAGVEATGPSSADAGPTK